MPDRPCFTVLIPVFNDWGALRLLLADLDRVAGENQLDVEVLAIDDGSTIPVPGAFHREARHLGKIELLHLKRNLGHQRAIAIGLVECYSSRPGRDVVVMDGDGEDSPQDVLRLHAKCRELGGAAIVFAERAKRAEGLVFQLFYTLSRYLHILLVGDKIRVGNFSLIPAALLGRLVYVSEIWNHYAAAVIHSRLPYALVPIDKSKRLTGESKMNFAALVLHGLSAISVYGELAGVRIAILLAIVWLLVGAAAIVRSLAAGGIGTFSLALLLVVLFQMLVILFMTVLIILLSRSQTHFVPPRDCPIYVAGKTLVE